MTVQQLIDKLEQIEDKTKEIKESKYGFPINSVLEFDDYVYVD